VVDEQGPPELLEVRSDDDIVRARRSARERAVTAGLRLVDQTKLITAVSELARNMTRYAGGGTVTLSIVADRGRRGVRAIFTDQGPGIPDIEQAMRNGYTTGAGLGLGLGGAKRLVHEFDLDTEPGRGTTVTVTMWG
jgi:serine/threonine-protein kinase RsbT